VPFSVPERQPSLFISVCFRHPVYLSARMDRIHTVMDGNEDLDWGGVEVCRCTTG